MAKRRKYSKEFKSNAVSLVLDQGHSRSEAARILDINAALLGRWLKEFEPEEDQAFQGGGETDSGNGTWVRQMIQEIVDSRGVGPTTVENLDDFLIWLGGKPGLVSDQISAAFEERSISVEAAQTMALWVLDGYLFADDQTDPLRTLGLKPGSSQKEIRNRYHRLIRVYHPDKEAFKSEWGTKRTEALNTVYTRLKHKPPDTQDHIESSFIQKPKPPGATTTERQAYPSEPILSRLRGQLGPAESVTRLFLITITAIAMFFIVILYVSSLTDDVVPLKTKTELTGVEQTGVASVRAEDAMSSLSPEQPDTGNILTSNVLEEITPTYAEPESGEDSATNGKSTVDDFVLDQNGKEGSSNDAMLESTTNEPGDSFEQPESIAAKEVVPDLTEHLEPELTEQARQTREQAVPAPAAETVVAVVSTPTVATPTELIEPTTPEPADQTESGTDETQTVQTEMATAGGIPSGHNDNQWLFAQPPDYWTLQLISTSDEDEARGFIVRKKLGEGAAYFESRIGDKPIYYVLYRSYPTLNEAKAMRTTMGETPRPS